jgi:hypothetical protein
LTARIIQVSFHEHFNLSRKFTNAHVNARPIIFFVGLDDGFESQILLIRIRLRYINESQKLQDKHENEKEEQFLHHTIFSLDSFILELLFQNHGFFLSLESFFLGLFSLKLSLYYLWHYTGVRLSFVQKYLANLHFISAKVVQDSNLDFLSVNSLRECEANNVPAAIEPVNFSLCVN